MLAIDKIYGVEGGDKLIEKCGKLSKGQKLFKSGNSKGKKLAKSKKPSKVKICLILTLKKPAQTF